MTFIPTDDGRWVSEHYERLARVIQDYDQSLALSWIPPDRRTREDKEPYAVIDTRTNTVVLFASELEQPESILGRLFCADNLNGNVLDKLESHNAAIELMKLKEWEDELEDLADKALFMKQSPLHTLRFNGKKFDHNRRVISDASK